MDEMRVFSVSELEQFDGKDGRPAYVGFDGKVYDLTGSSFWPDGEHESCADGLAGRDLTDVMEDAPPDHREELEGWPVVGTLE